MSSDPDSITIFSDYVCPFCYLGRQSLETYQQRRDEELTIEWHPFDLRRTKRGPDGEIDQSIDDGKDDAYYDEVRKNVERLKESYGATEMLSIDAVPDGVDSFDTQVASLYVREEYPEHWLEFDEAIFDALWIEGRDIGDIEVIADVADSVGLPVAEIREAVTDPARRDTIRERFSAAQSNGVVGVPMFVYDGYGARGAVPPAQLARLVEGP